MNPGLRRIKTQSLPAKNPQAENRGRALHPSDGRASTGPPYLHLPARRVTAAARVTDGYAGNQGDPEPGWRRISDTASSSGLTAVDCPPAGPPPARGRVFGVFERCGCLDEDALFGAFMVQTVSSQTRPLQQS